MKFGSLFTGIGGFDLGFERAGMKCSWQVEIDPFCNKVLEKHWPDVLRYQDIKAVKNPPKVDLICGGFPCQPYSVAGKRKGEKDKRNLWPEMYRVIREVKPKWVVGENVPGLLTFTYFKKICTDLESQGYEVLPLEFPAAAVGAPHRRYRIFIIAYNGEKRIERIGENSIRRFKGFSWCENVRGITDLRKRSDLPEPLICGTSNGIPSWMDRVGACGNAVVPQVAEWIGRIIISAG